MYQCCKFQVDNLFLNIIDSKEKLINEGVYFNLL